jgi:hypothetical protein
LSLAAAADDFATYFVTEDKRRRTTFVMAIIGVHVGTTNTAGFNADERFAVFRLRIGFVPILELHG